MSTDSSSQTFAESFIHQLADQTGHPAAPVIVKPEEDLLGYNNAMKGRIELGRKWVTAPKQAQQFILAHEFAHTTQSRRARWGVPAMTAWLLSPLLVGAIAAGYVYAATNGRAES